MNNPQFESVINVVIDTPELVRGQEQAFLEQLTPLVHEQSVTLDLRNVTRIDAAGLAALISLYCAARSAGNRFGVRCASSHVAEMLALVGLDGVLLQRNETALNCGEPDCPEFALQLSAV
jgi:anti-anti-sigma factor